MRSPGHQPASRRAAGVFAPLLALTLAAALFGCAAPPSGPVPASASVPTASVPPVPVVPSTPLLPPPDPVAVFVDARLNTMTLRQKVASLFMLHRPGTDSARIAAFVAEYQPGGLILMGDNVPSNPAKLPALIERIEPDPALPLLIGIDQEGGIVRRIRADKAPSAAKLRNRPASATREAFASRGALLAELGVSVNFGIVADETDDTGSFIYPRVLGTTPKDAASRVAQAVKGESGLVLSTLKHFPGHGVAAGDSHSSIPSSDLSLSSWRRSHALPFVAGIAAGAEFVMLGHLRMSAVDELPATLSPRWHRILRNDLGFDGIIVSDDMLMLQRSGEAALEDPAKNAIAALAAGTTLLLYVLPEDPRDVDFDPDRVIDDIVEAVADGRLSEATIDDAAHRLFMVRRAQALG